MKHANEIEFQGYFGNTTNYFHNEVQHNTTDFRGQRKYRELTQKLVSNQNIANSRPW